MGYDYGKGFVTFIQILDSPLIIGLSKSYQFFVGGKDLQPAPLFALLKY